MRQCIQEVLRSPKLDRWQKPDLSSLHILSDMLGASMLAAFFDSRNAEAYAHRSYLAFDDLRTGEQGHRLYRATAIRGILWYLFQRSQEKVNTAMYAIR